MNLFKKYWGLILVIIVSLIPLAPLLHPGLPLTHDGQDHVARIANFYQSLSEGEIVPRWAANLNWGYGHPILMFLYPLSSYSASLFHFLGFSLVDSTKLVFALAFILSGVTMYFWVRQFSTKEAAIASALIYNFAPYRFVDLYVRGAIGEHVAFIFPPLILYFLIKIAKEDGFNRFYFCFCALSIAGLILAHNAISIIFLPFIILYGIYLYFYTAKNYSFVIQMITIFFLGFCLSAFFLVPAFIEGKYTLRDKVTEGITLGRFVNFKDLLYGPWNFGQSGIFSVQVGIASWLAVMAGIASLFLLKIKREVKLLMGLAILYFVVSILIMLPISLPIWESISTLQKFQFPWRFLSVSIFCAAVLGGIAISSIHKKYQIFLTFFVIIVLMITTVNYWQPKGYLQQPEAFYSGVYSGTTDTGESAPIWSVRFMEHTASSAAQIIKGKGKVQTIFRSSTRHEYEIVADEKIRVRENTLYFPGWRVYIDGVQYQSVEFQDPANRGLMTYYVPKGKHKVVVAYGNTRLRTIADYISLGALTILIGIILKTFKK